VESYDPDRKIASGNPDDGGSPSRGYGLRRGASRAQCCAGCMGRRSSRPRGRGLWAIVPAFAVGRTQELIYYFHQLTRQGRFCHLNIFVDSPMATGIV
jgi:hypothetical protein